MVESGPVKGRGGLRETQKRTEALRTRWMRVKEANFQQQQAKRFEKPAPKPKPKGLTQAQRRTRRRRRRLRVLPAPPLVDGPRAPLPHLLRRLRPLLPRRRPRPAAPAPRDEARARAPHRAPNSGRRRQIRRGLTSSLYRRSAPGGPALGCGPGDQEWQDHSTSSLDSRDRRVKHFNDLLFRRQSAAARRLEDLRGAAAVAWRRVRRRSPSTRCHGSS